MDGWIKLNRKLVESACFKDSQILHVWIFLLLDANHGESRRIVGNQIVSIKPGQMVTSRKRIVEATGLNRSKVERILNTLKSEQQIEQQSFTKYRIITICNWDQYQNCEQQIEQQMSNRRATGEHIKECKEYKEVKEVSLAQKPRKPRPPSGDQQLFIAWWKMAYKKTMDACYVMSAKDAKNVQGILQEASVKEALSKAATFFISDDEFYKDKKDISFFRSQINKIPKANGEHFARLRDIGIIPPEGTKLENWQFWELDNG